MNRTTLTGALDYGGNWRLTADLLELNDADDKPTRIFAVRDIRAVSRESFRLRLVLGGGEFAEIECGSLADAVNLEDGLKQRINTPDSTTPQGQPHVAPQTNPRRKVENIVITIVLSVIGVFALLAWIGNNLPPSGRLPASTSSNISSAGSTAPVASRVDFSGSSQQATRLFPLQIGLARFEVKHSGEHHFSAWLMDSQGKRIDLIANDVGPFNGSRAVRIPASGSYLLDVSAFDSWAITVTQ